MLKDRMSNQITLTEDMLNNDKIEHVQTLLFARTSPLLVLRSIPSVLFQCFDDTYDIEIIEKDEEEEEVVVEESDNQDQVGTNESEINRHEEEEDEVEEEGGVFTMSLDRLKLYYKSTRKQLSIELMKRMYQIYEYEQVRKLSSEILSTFPVMQYTIRYGVHYLKQFNLQINSNKISTQNDNNSKHATNEAKEMHITNMEQNILLESGADTTIARAVIYNLCHCIMLWCDGSKTENASKSVEMLTTHALPWLLRLLAYDLILPEKKQKKENEENTEETVLNFEKLQKGCMDCVACLCKASHVIYYAKNVDMQQDQRSPMVVDVTEIDSTTESTTKSMHDCKKEEEHQRSLTLIMLEMLCGDLKLNTFVTSNTSSTAFNFLETMADQTNMFELQSDQTLRVCVANVLITAMKMWPPSSSPSPSSSSSNESSSSTIMSPPKKNIIIMPNQSSNFQNTQEDFTFTPKTSMLRVILRTLTAVCLNSNQMSNPVVRSAAIQVIFIGLHSCKDASTITRMVAIDRLHALSMGACQDQTSDDVRMSGLKLLGMIIGKVPDLFEKVMPGAGGYTKNVLSRLKNVDASGSVRELAEKIYGAVFK